MLTLYSLTALFLGLTPSAGAASLSYDEALQRAEEVNPEIGRAQASVDAAEGALSMTRGVYDPALGMGISNFQQTSEGRNQGITYTNDINRLAWYTSLGQTLPTGTSWSLDWENSRVGATTEYTIAGQLIEDRTEGDFNTSLTASLTQQLLQGHRMSYNLEGVRLATAARDQAEAALLQQRQNTLAQVATAYWTLVDASAAVEIAEEAVGVAKEERRIVQAQVQAGNMARVEVTRVDAAVAQSELSLLEAEYSRATASDALATLLAMPLSDGIEPSTPPGEVQLGLAIDADRAVESALEGNPGLVRLRVDVDNAELQLMNAKHARMPSLGATVAYGVQGFDQDGGYAGATQEMFAGNLRNLYGGLDFSMPLGGRVERGDVMSSAAAVTQARLALEASEREVAQQVAGHVRTLETASRKVQLAELNQRLAEETLAAEKARQDAGRAIEKDVLEAQRALDVAKVGAVSARTDYRRALVQLRALQGKL